MSSEPPDEAIRPELLLVLLLVVVAVVYAPALGGGFLWDDRPLILEAPLVKTLHPLADYFTRSFWSGSVSGPTNATYYRPLATLSYALDWRLHGGNPAGFHLTNLALHLVNTGLVYAYLRRFSSTGWMAVTGAAVWALAPRLAEAVAWISGRTDVLCATFVLLALILPRSALGRIAAALCLFLGLLVKELALAGVVALVVRELCSDDARRARILGCLAPLLALGAYAILRATSFGFSARGTALGILGRSELVAEALGRTLVMLLDPWQPNALQGRVGAPSLLFVALGAVAALALIAAIVRFFPRLRERPAWLEPLALAVSGLGLVLHLFPIPAPTVTADRFLYLPLVGVIAASVPPAERLLRRSGVARIGALALVASLLVVTVYRARAWADEVGFWVAEQRHSPRSSIAWIELSGVYFRAGLFAESLELSRRAFAQNDSRQRAGYNQFLSLARLGRYREAHDQLVELARHGRDKLDVEFARLELQQGRYEPAREALKRASASPSERPRARELGRALVEIERQQARLADPTFAASETGAVLRAEIATQLANYRVATELWLALLERTRDPELARHVLARLLSTGQLGDLTRALELYQARFKVVPDELAEAYAVRKAEIERALKAKPELGL